MAISGRCAIARGSGVIELNPAKSVSLRGGAATPDIAAEWPGSKTNGPARIIYDWRV
jgi:hypothetical protein